MPKIHALSALTPEGWQADLDVEIAEDGRISGVSPHDGPADHTLDLLLPAPVNLHSHSFQRAMAGLTESRGPDPKDSFWTWRRLMYRFLGALSPDQVEAIAALAFVEMAEAGYSAVAEFHYIHHGPGGQPYEKLGELTERIAAAAQATGLGLTHVPVYYEFGGCDRRPLEGGQKRFGNDIERFQRLLAEAKRTIASGPADWRIGVAPHSLRSVDKNGLTAALALADGLPFHMHLAEQIAEVDEVVAHHGARPVDWLLNNADVMTNWCLIHCTQMTDAETQKLAQTGAVAGLCPITESSLGDGIFNGTGFAAADGRIGVGTDSNIQISFFEELKTLEYSQRLRDRSRAVYATAQKSTGRVLFEATVAGGMQATQRDAGRIEPGAFADLVGLSTDNPWICGRSGDAALDSLIFAGGGKQCVREVWSAGRHIVRQGRHVARDAAAKRFSETVEELGQEI